MKKTILCLLLFISFSTSHAKTMNGKMALAFCKDNVQCALIAASYSDGFSYALQALSADNTVFCLPAGTSSGLLGRVFRRYLAENPE